jgi:voltage-gated potassium channel
MSTLKEKVFDILDYNPGAGPVEKVVTFGLIALIVANVLAVILQAEPGLGETNADFFNAFEFFSVAIFIIEYLLRVWSITVDPRYREPVSGRLRFMVTPLAIVDVLAIAPAFLPLVAPLDLRTLRILRLFRVIRLFKITRYSEALGTFSRVIERKRPQLTITAIVALMIFVIASGLIFTLEHEAQPDEFPSITGTMWWTLETLTTVGYGDVYPITTAGKVIGGLVSMLGIAFFGLPAGILAAGFIEEIQREGYREAKVCPHCGRGDDEEMDEVGDR